MIPQKKIKKKIEIKPVTNKIKFLEKRHRPARRSIERKRAKGYLKKSRVWLQGLICGFFLRRRGEINCWEKVRLRELARTVLQLRRISR